MKKIFLLLVILIAVNTLSAQVRNTKWGWSPDSVKKVETLTLVSKSKDLLVYEGGINGDQFQIMYSFDKNKLYSIMYLYKETHLNLNRYIEKFNHYREILLLKYPFKSADREIWKGSRYKGQPENYGMAVSMGELQFFYRADNADTDVSLMCTGDNFQIQLAMLYLSKKFSEGQSDTKLQLLLSEF